MDAFLGNDSIGLPFMLQEAGRSSRALRRGHWKYIAASKSKKSQKVKRAELYDLATDIAEQTNVIEQYPEIAQSMAEQLQDSIKSAGLRK